MKFTRIMSADEEHITFVIDGEIASRTSYDEIGSEGMRSMSKMFEAMAKMLGEKVVDEFEDWEE